LWRDWIACLRLPTIERYREKVDDIEQGMDEAEAMLQAAAHRRH